MVALLTFASFAAALLLVSGAALLILGSWDADLARRLEEISRSQVRTPVTAGAGLVRDEMLSDIPRLHRVLSHWSWPTRLRVFLLQAGWDMRPAKFLLLSGVLSLGVNETLAWLGWPGVGGVAAITAGASPFVAASWKRKRRFQQFQKHFPEAIDLLSRAVRAGHAFTAGLELISKELSEPVAGEFRMTFDEYRLGMPLREALLRQVERMPLTDMRFFVSSLLIQKESGGNLAEVLDNLSRMIRERFRIFREVRVRTAQGRLTAGILIALPPLLLLALGGLNPEYVQPLFKDRWGHYLLAGAAGLQLMGSAMLWKIVQIEV